MKSHAVVASFAAAFILSAGMSQATAQTQTTSEAIWQSYVANPDDHPHIPNNSYAGYRRGEVEVPAADANGSGVTVRVTDHGATADDEGADDAAFRKAIEAAWLAGGGTVEVPAGTFRFADPIWLKHSGVVLRGQGRGRTILEFTRPLIESVGQANPNGTHIWSWTGGLVWVGPSDHVVYTEPGSDDRLRIDTRSAAQDYQGASSAWELWRQGGRLAGVEGSFTRGQRTIVLDDASSITVGQFLLMTWENSPDHALFLELAQHPLFEGWDGWGQWFEAGRFPHWQWPVEVASVEGNRVTLAQPLRVAIEPAFKVQLWKLGAYVEEVGVEDLTIQLHGTDDGKTYDLGWNGVFLNRAYNCWVRNVEVVNGNNGFHVSASKNCSLLNTRVAGDNYYHHPYTNRCMSADVLYEDFVVDISEDSHGGTHGINTEFLTSGNVWSRGTMNRGTLDTHRAMAFDMIRTQITLRNEKHSNPGGSKKAGPYALRRMVHWNLEVRDSDRPESERGLYVNQPENHTFGALVGIRGAAISEAAAWEDPRGGVMPVGDKGVLIADLGEVPTPVNLYEAQLDLRRKTHKWAALASPSTGFVRAGEAARGVTLRASVNAGGAKVKRVSFVAGGRTLGTVDAPPYELTWRPEPGRYDVEVVMEDDAGGTTRSASARPVTVGSVAALEESDPRLTWSPGWKEDVRKGDGWSGGGMASLNSGEYVETTFRGTRLVLISDGDKRYDSEFSVLIDGEEVVTKRNIRGRGGADLVAYDTGWLPDGEHTVRIVATRRLPVDRVIVYQTSVGSAQPAR